MPNAKEPDYNWYYIYPLESDQRQPRNSLRGFLMATETVFFSLDGDDYAINLGPGSAEDFRAELAPFIERARKVGEKSLEQLREELHKDQGEIYYQPPFHRLDYPMALDDEDGMVDHPGPLPDGPPPLSRPHGGPQVPPGYFD